jgi:hypothetical protein
MAPLVDQDMRDRLQHRVAPLLLVQAGNGRAEHLGKTCAVDRNKGLDLPRNEVNPSKRPPQRGTICLRENITTAQQLDGNNVREPRT